jgi:hypothetical protein
MATNKIILAELASKMLSGLSSVELHRIMGIIEGMKAAKEIHREAAK